MAYNPDYSESNALQHLSLQRESGLSIAEYCRRHTINASTFYGWNKRLKAKSDNIAQNKNPLPFLEIPVRPSISHADSNIHISRTEITLPSDTIQHVCDVFKDLLTSGTCRR
ncbi:MAG: transposase [Chitinivibrionales bacterium]|nr:transposase [Chitinivibrionales bacterium]